MNERRIEPPSAYGKKRGKSKVLEKVVDIRSREKEKERERAEEEDRKKWRKGHAQEPQRLLLPFIFTASHLSPPNP